MKLDSFFDPTKVTAAFKFADLGASASGLIVQAPELVPDQFNEGKQALRLDLETNDGHRRPLFARGQMLDAIGAAVMAVEADELQQGGHITVTYSDDKVLRSGRTMKVYEATYVPPAPMDIAALTDSDDAEAIF